MDINNKIYVQDLENYKDYLKYQKNYSDYTIENYSTYTFDGKKLSDLAADAGINTSATPYTTYMGILAGSGTDDETIPSIV